MAASIATVRRLLRTHFGLEEFRPGQREIIGHLLQGRDVLGVLPTGAGKSLTYQLTAQVLPGLTIVVSPLLALMQDQVVALRERGIAVSAINSTQTAREAQQQVAQALAGQTNLLYVTPERFGNARFMAALRGRHVSLFVVDEAHCITDWGHSFRPAYLELPHAIEQVGRPPVLALTATATPWIRREIGARLGLRDPAIVVRGFDRPNLFLEVVRVEQEHDDRRVLQQLLLEAPAAPEPLADELARAMQGSGIIYTATTRAARETARWLRAWGIAADYYHGQRKKADRERVQQAFMTGAIRVIVATNAFGLGVDKPDVRFVIHRDTPASLEAYYQEAGRAGRDGAPARCVLIYRPADLSRAAFLAGSGELTRAEVEQAWAGLLAHPRATRSELAQVTGLNRADLARLLTALKQARIVRERRGRVELLRPEVDPADVPLEQEQRRLAYEQSRVEMMRGYAESAACRRRTLLAYFGEPYEQERCNFCDNDRLHAAQPRVVIATPTPIDTRFTPGDAVRHQAWGPGVVQDATSDTITVLFDQVGYKTLDLAAVSKQGLLQHA